MVDNYLWGQVGRISPEAPVPVVEVFKEENRPGGAANVALNLGALGAKPVLCGMIGDDAPGKEMLDILELHEYDTSLIEVDPSRQTTVKTRVIGNLQQMLRVDREDADPLEESVLETLKSKVLKQVQFFDAVIFQDYDKGVLSPGLIQAITWEAEAHKIPVIVDPKNRNFMDFSGCSLFKPNLKELNDALNLKLIKNDFEGIVKAVESLRRIMPHSHTLITLSEYGVLGVYPDGNHFHLPAFLRKVRDVSGAGDTVVSVLGLGFACGLDFELSARVANLAGGLVCEEAGVVPVKLERLQQEVKEKLELKR